MSIHHAIATIKHSSFSGSKSDDGLNIKNSSISVINSRFTGNLGDQFDCDYCVGEVENNYFEGLIEDTSSGDGTDGLDVSGSNVSVSENKFKGFSDKAISVGERSSVKIDANSIMTSNIGIAVKDSSVAELSNNRFHNNVQDVTEYIKKLMYSDPTVIYK